MTDLSVTAASNSPQGSESPTSGDDFLRAIQAILRTTNAKGADIASATTTDIGAATGEFIDVTGTTTITGLGTIAAGIVRTVRFTGALTLTHNATSLILPGSANITTANGDVAMFRSLGSGNWKCVGYLPQAGYAAGGANSNITSLTGLTTPLSVAQGGTGATTNAGTAYALKGANSDITSLSALSTPLSVAQGGTGSATLTANNVLLGNGTSALQAIAPGTSGNVLTSDGTTWASAAPAITGGYTLLGTLTTTSGTTQTLSGLTLTNYIKLYIVVSGVSFTGNSITMTLGGVACSVSSGAGGAGQTQDGTIDLDLTNGMFSFITNAGASGQGFGDTTYSTASTSIVFAGGTFDAGTIKVYGVK